MPTPLEQLVLEFVWKHPNCTAEMCREGLIQHRKFKDSTIRTVLRKLEEKGYATHEVDRRTFLYRAVETKRNVGVRAVKQLVDRFCNGSVEELLVGLVDNRILDPKQLRRLADEIASRKEKTR
jgi:BlaI family transcriptional regulator, penicillinase repressor